MTEARRPAPSLPLGPLMVDLGGETLSADESDFLRHPAVGAVILFARNYRSKAQVRALVAEVKALRSPALLVAVDQEGGRVQRFTDGFHPLPAPGRIGELYDRDRERALALSSTAGQLMAAEVLQTGVDFSFAPVLDCRHPHSGVIGERAFHRDPAAVCDLARAYIAGMKRAGMAATGKHFPGHGGVSADSHHELPVDSRSLNDIAQRDLLPFARLAPHLAGIMTAHLLFEHIDRQPPTYSPFWLKKMLREELNFTGVIFSDDLSMKGAGTAAPPAKTLAALTAGCDMALVCNDSAGARRAADGLGGEYVGEQERLLGMQADVAAETDPAENKKMAEELVAGLE